MTALQYMQKQLHRHKQNYKYELTRNAPDEVVRNIALKISYYSAAVAALQKEKGGAE